MMYVWCTYDVRIVSSHGGCIERLVLGQNSFWLGNCYDLLHSGMDFQWILKVQKHAAAQSFPPSKWSFTYGKVRFGLEIHRMGENSDEQP